MPTSLNSDLIVFDQVTKRFAMGGDSIEALHQLDLRVAEQSIVGLVGPSGCGKSTTLRLIAGLTFTDEGRVFVGGEEVRGTNSRIGFMLQKDLLMPWKTVLENAELGLQVQGVPKVARRERVEPLLAMYGLANFLHYRPHQLSGGMRQRVALARTMALDPEILLLDEPFAAVDFQTKLVLQQDLLSILQETKKTVLYITHDIGEAISLCHRVIVLTRRPARVKKEYSIDIPSSLSLMEKRNHPSFNDYFNAVWQQLDLDVKVRGR